MEKSTMTLAESGFSECFTQLMGFAPLSWQRRLYHEHFLTGNLPGSLDLPTGLGKTAVLPLWYLAFKQGAPVPRRLVYVVDRRAVVDQATEMAEIIKWRSDDTQLQVSTLRGQYIDNKAWLIDPGAPGIIVGTIDMIGSRLLFSGYGVSRKMRPYHAGMLGVDTLVVLDEAHLCPPFEALLSTIATDPNQFGPESEEEYRIVVPLRLMSLSATGRNTYTVPGIAFHLTDSDRQDKIVRKRLLSSKYLALTEVDDAKELAPTLADKALSRGLDGAPARVLIYCHRRADAQKIRKRLDTKLGKKQGHRVALFVGGRRVKEREDLRHWLQCEGNFLGPKKSLQHSTFLIATSAGEVGVDLDADHMVCDLVTWERMVQRLGRVNRRGEGEAFIDVVAAPPPTSALPDYLDRLRSPIKALPYTGKGKRHDASPDAIVKLKQNQANLVHPSDMPLFPRLSRALVDAWSMTSLNSHTGRPEVVPWLRGWEEDSQPQTSVVWRMHLPIRVQGPTAMSPSEMRRDIEAFFEAAPIHVSEKLEIETDEVAQWLKRRCNELMRTKSSGEAGNNVGSANNVFALVMSLDGDFRRSLRVHDIVTASKRDICGCIAHSVVIVTSNYGGLKDGMLDHKSGDVPRTVDDERPWMDDPSIVGFRIRKTEDMEENSVDPEWQERFRYGIDLTEEGEELKWLVVEQWRHDSATEDDRAVGSLQSLDGHQKIAEIKAGKLAGKLGLPDSYAEMLSLAAKLHDEGKKAPRWQQAANAPVNGTIYAKTRGPFNAKLLDGYRHELGSVLQAMKAPECLALSDDLQDLLYHIIAAHHGSARPSISTSGYDNAPPSELQCTAIEIAMRTARLQKHWGPWGLAWWETLLRAVDQQASQEEVTEGQ